MDIFLLTGSMLLRIITFAVVMNYINVSRHRIAWLLIAGAMLLMALENFFQLLEISGISDLASNTSIPPVAGFVVSLLMLSGTVLIRTILKRLNKAERTRSSINSRYQMLFNSSSDQIFVLDMDGRIVEVNNSACERLGYSRDELLKKQFSDLKSTQATEGLFDHMPEIRKKHIHIFESEHQSVTNQRIPVELSCRLIEIDEKPYITCVARNITERKELEKKVLTAIIETEETERSRFAKEIHDGLGPLLSTIKLYVNELETASDSAEREEFIRYTNKLIDEAVTTARNIANNITPKIITDYGLIKSIDNFCESINATNLLHITFEHHEVGREIGSTLELTLYRIITELINNTIKHAQASQVLIRIVKSANRLRLVYTDDGIGFDFDKAMQKAEDRMGVKNIVSRVRSLKGDFRFRNTEPGIEINIDVDLQQARQA